jgi:phosphatidylserine/phosphatidylglycerophosphate/cardiolipin synthase-like enzyme
VDGLQGISRADAVVFHERAELHAKGIVGDRYSLLGSMNLTFNGLERLTEMLVFQNERGSVEQSALLFGVNMAAWRDLRGVVLRPR